MAFSHLLPPSLARAPSPTWQRLKLLSTPLDAIECAHFMRATPQLSKSALGEYLSERHDFESAVLKSYVGSFEFVGQEIDMALRMFLQAFRLPGEAQKIDRLMEAFAGALFAANPEPFANADAAYVLAFAIIMLNTDLHSPNIVRPSCLIFP